VNEREGVEKFESVKFCFKGVPNSMKMVQRKSHSDPYLSNSRLQRRNSGQYDELVNFVHLVRVYVCEPVKNTE